MIFMMTKSVSYDEADAPEAFERLIDAYPEHQDVIQSCMWMGKENAFDGKHFRDIHHFKHIETRNRFAFSPNPDGSTGGLLRGVINTGETSADADAVFANIKN